MAFGAVTEAVSIEAYRSGSWEPAAEYVDGVIEARPMGEREHAAWQKAIRQWFLPREGQWRARALPELRVQTAPRRLRVPDVAVRDTAQPYEAVVTHPPVAVFEVLSPEDTFTRLLRKLENYAAMGIRHVWVIDPDGPRYFRYADGALAAAGEFGAPGDAMHFRLDQIAQFVPRP